MARPIKSGLDYFPLDTEWDIKMQLVKARFGILGIGCIIELYKLIYHEGYALKWDNDTRLLFAASNHIDEKDLTDVVVFAIEKGVFSTEKYSALGVLTSRGIQKRWLRIAKESNRTIKTIDKTLDLISEENTLNRLSVSETRLPIPDIPAKNELPVPESTQSIVKERREKKRDKEGPPLPLINPSKDVALPDPLYQAIFQSFIVKAGAFTNYPKEAQAIKRIIKYCEQHAARYADGDKIKLAEKVVTKYYELTQNGNGFWRGQPFTPSSLSASGIFDRVLVEISQMQEEDVTDGIPF
jgi:hypothetical protein